MSLRTSLFNKIDNMKLEDIDVGEIDAAMTALVNAGMLSRFVQWEVVDYARCSLVKKSRDAGSL